MAGLSIGMKRRETTHREGKHSRVDIVKKVTVEIWASNLTLDLFKADCLIAAWDVETGKQVYSRRVADLDLLANQSTEIISLPVPATPGNENRTVVAAYLCQESGAPVARHVNWPEPFKHLHLQKPSQLRVELDVDGEAVQISAEVSVKGLAVDCTDESVRFDDNLVDIVPGESMRIGVRGASKETVLTTQYLGMMT
ncbi:hypothetical protein DCS_04505 [Drechmeria coniospora]|uniref:Uncharacterized protein n=1 Tax=Drechmeria coniospora TaxID=98403 RepID=A0A151GK61_DRECN|nr:hypothetical protein DCS_04505 [Drechmeria coniospora]KYK57495.1 hypothetical protein DCS_04505 [Drechmeria coniospora]